MTRGEVCPDGQNPGIFARELSRWRSSPVSSPPPLWLSPWRWTGNARRWRGQERGSGCSLNARQWQRSSWISKWLFPSNRSAFLHSSTHWISIWRWFGSLFQTWTWKWIFMWNVTGLRIFVLTWCAGGPRDTGSCPWPWWPAGHTAPRTPPSSERSGWSRSRTSGCCWSSPRSSSWRRGPLQWWAHPATSPWAFRWGQGPRSASSCYPRSTDHTACEVTWYWNILTYASLTYRDIVWGQQTLPASQSPGLWGYLETSDLESSQTGSAFPDLSEPECKMVTLISC